MKKLILLLSLFALTLTSCNSDDDSPPTESATIVGSWQFFKSFENNVEQSLELCEPEQTLIFSDNGTLTIVNYEAINGICELADNITGTWSQSETIFNVTILGMTESEEILIEGNTFYVQTTDGTGTNQVTYRDVYKKL